jgi:hypothetical protein
MSFFLRISEKIYKTLESHGPILIILISLIFLSNLFNFIVLTFFSTSVIEQGYSLYLVYIFALLSFINLIFMVKLFALKKWAFYAYYSCSIIFFSLDILSGNSKILSVKALFLPLLLFIFMLPKLKNFN